MLRRIKMTKGKRFVHMIMENLMIEWKTTWTFSNVFGKGNRASINFA